MVRNVFSLFNRQYDPEYKFRGLTPSSSASNYLDNVEGITFDNFDSIDQGWWLLEREAPTPSEKEVTIDIPYSQGVRDFSILNGQRYFDNRKLKYKLVVADSDYNYRKAKENEAKRLLMYSGISPLIDTHNPGFIWNAKCTSVEADDDEKEETVTLTVEFSAYPFAIQRNYEGSDIWDDINFDNWKWQDVTYKAGTAKITNWGNRPVWTTFECDSNFTITCEQQKVEVTPDNASSKRLLLQVGDNNIQLDGTGTLTFKFRCEVVL